MQTTREIIKSLESWQESELGKPISLTLAAAITQLKLLHEAAAQADEISNHLDDAIKGRLELKDQLADERTISDCLAGAISGTFDYSEAISRYNASLELPRSGIPPVNIFTKGGGAPRKQDAAEGW